MLLPTRGLTLLVGSILLPLSFAAVGPSTTLNVVNKFIAPDGFNRSTVLVDGVHPGPLIKGVKGDTFRLNVANSLSDPTMLRTTSIHWHGIFQHGTAWNDGPVGVTQCPIAPNHSFLYQFQVSNQAGTFWYHSHFDTQYCDGLRGPLVVYDPQDPHRYRYDVDDESTVITLSDWYHLKSPVIGIAPASSNATLINGKGRFVGGPQVDLAVINVQYGGRYRFRLVSLSCDPNYMFSIDGHNLTIIEADGQNTKPWTVDKIQIFAGQRYSFILEANQTIGNYWVRALPNIGFNNLSGTFDGGVNSAILRYKSAQIEDPTTTPPEQPMLLNEADLHPLTNPAAPGLPFPGGADVNLNFTLGFTAPRFTINGTSFADPDVPILLQIINGVNNVEDLLPKGSIYYLPPNKTVEVTIPAFAIGGPHPFHLHGHTFSVVKSAGSDTQFNFMDPVRRDVVSIGNPGSQVTIRFRTDNPGPFFLHCHIEFHLKAGLAIVFAEDLENIKATNPTPPSWDELCPIYSSLPPSATTVIIEPTPA